MNLEAPAALALGLALPAILLLWMLRPRRPRRRVPSLLLWPGSAAERQSARPWQRLRQHPLLWLQLAVAALLALAAARPFLPADATSRRLIVLLDASGSMQAHDVTPDRFSLAREAVLDLARRLGPDQELTLIRLDEQPRVLVAGARDAGPVEAALAGQKPSAGPADVATAVALAAGFSAGPAEWVLVSDGALDLPADARRPDGVVFRFVPIGQPAANVAVTGLSARAGPDGLALQAGLRSFARVPVAGRLQLLAEGEIVAAQDWRLEPGQETALTWSHLPPGPRWYEARLSGVAPTANALDLDDRAWAVVAAPAEPTVLLVTSGNTFLERFLAVAAGLRAFRATPADWPALAGLPQRYALTVLDRTWPESLPSGNALVVGPPASETFRPGPIWPRPDHPLLRHIDWSDVRIAAASRLPLGPDWTTVVDSDGGPLLLVREADGQRQALLTFDLGQSDLPLRPAFPILMANLLDWLLPRPDAALRTISPGGALTVDPAPLAEEIRVERVAGEAATGDGAAARPGSADAGQTEGSASAGGADQLAPPWPPRPFRPPAPGLYRIIQSGPDFRQESLVVAEGYHPVESSLESRVERPAAEGGPASGDGQPVSQHSSWWPWLAAAVLALSLLEWWVDARGR